MPDDKVRPQPSLLSEDDLFLFNQGSHLKIYNHLGAHPMVGQDGKPGVYFAVWAPNAHAVYVFGDFNGWEKWSHPLYARGASGIWEGFVPGADVGHCYKYHIESKEQAYKVDKADPVGFRTEAPPKSGSVVCDLSYKWRDQAWMEQRAATIPGDMPTSIYEVHLGSWRRTPDNLPLNYRDLADQLAEYVSEQGFTHVELMPVMEHPFYGSWGYQVTGYFAPTSRYGSIQDFMYLVDTLHRHNIGVILDWVPSHFPGDEHGLGFFDGTHLYEHADPKEGFHPDWNSYIFNYGRDEVASFLLSSAFFWLDVMHADGLRVDAVASMLYRDYSREDGEWVPNKYGGNENLEAVEFLRRLNQEVYSAFPGAQTIAEESTAWPMVSRPVYVGGLGFGQKWDMGWMNDTLEYFSRDPIHRHFHHTQLTFRMMYAFSENFVLSLSHDEVVHGKGSLIGKMPGDDWQKFANLRLLFADQFAQPGKKLLFMGCEFGQYKEWNHEASLDWHLLEHAGHRGVQRLVADLNRLYVDSKAMYQGENHEGSFQWLDCNDAANSIVAFVRKGWDGQRILVVMNCTPVPRTGYRLGVDKPGLWVERLNTDSEYYGGSGMGNAGGFDTEPVESHGFKQSLMLTLPPLSAIFMEWQEG